MSRRRLCLPDQEGHRVSTSRVGIGSARSVHVSRGQVAVCVLTSSTAAPVTVRSQDPAHFQRRLTSTESELHPDVGDHEVLKPASETVTLYLRRAAPGR